MDGRGTGAASSRLLDAYRMMWRIRRFEEIAIELISDQRIFGSVHPSIGQEAVAVGVMSALEPADRIVSNHRGHGHLLAKGADLRRVFAELLGRVDGYCGGHGGSMHIAAVDRGMLGANGIVAGGAGIAAGSAFAAQKQGSDVVTVAFFGDGATGQGSLWEAMLLSSTWKLPIVWLCENNQIAALSQVEHLLPVAEVADLVSDALMPTRRLDGNDVEEVRGAAEWAVAHARGGGGPVFLEAVTFRTLWHSFRYAGRPDSRPEELRREWAERDPLERARQRLRQADPDVDARLAGLHEEVDAELREALEAADRSPFPDPARLGDVLYATPIGGRT